MFKLNIILLLIFKYLIIYNISILSNLDDIVIIFVEIYMGGSR